MQEFIIDLSDIRNENDFHNILASTFDFPSYYGRNFSAIFDLLGEYDNKKISITFLNCKNVKTEITQMMNILTEILDELQIHYNQVA